MFRRLFRSFTVQSDHILLEEHRNLFRIGAQAQDEVHVVLRAQLRQHLHDRFRIGQLGPAQLQEREYRPFRKIKDGYPRYIISLDSFCDQREGVHHINAIDLFLGKEKI